MINNQTPNKIIPNVHRDSCDRPACDGCAPVWINEPSPKIIGIVPVGSTVKITESADPRFPHPWSGRVVEIVSTTGGVGGIGGGGSVKITDGSTTVDVSRYTRVMIIG